MACLKACKELHSLGALTDYLLPASTKQKPEFIEVQSDSDSEGLVLYFQLFLSHLVIYALLCMLISVECLTIGKGFHVKAVPEVFRSPVKCIDDHLNFHFYFLDLKPMPDDRKYKEFGLFVASPLPKEVENMEVDLCLTHCRIVKTVLVHSGDVMFDMKMVNIGFLTFFFIIRH